MDDFKEACLSAGHQPLEEVLRIYPEVVVATWEGPTRQLLPFIVIGFSSIFHKHQVQHGKFLLRSIELVLVRRRLERCLQQGQLIIFDTI